MSSTETKGGRFRDALRSRDYRLLIAAFVIDGLGGWAYLTVIVVYVFERSDSTTWIALVTAAGWIPRLLVGSYAGVLADRFPRTRVMVLSALGSGVMSALMAVVIATDGPLGLLLVLTAVAALVNSAYPPAAGALTPDLVPERDLTAANGLQAALDSAVVVIGPGVGALLLAVDEPTVGVMLNSASFFIAALLVSRIRTHSQGDVAESGDSAFRAFLNGFGALRAERVAFVLVIFCALDSAVYGACTVLYIPISEKLGTGTDGFGYLLAGMALGGVISAGLANRLSTSRRLAPVIVGGIALQAVPFALTTLVETPALGFLLQVVSGAGMIFVDVLAITALQRSIARGVLGRVMGLLDVAVLLAIVLASFGFSALLSATDLDQTLLILGIGFPAVAVLGIGPLLRADRNALALLRQVEPRVAVLKELDLFAKATQSMLEQLARAIEVVDFDSGTDVIRQGEPADALWIISEGEVTVTVDGDFVRTMGPGTYLGEIGLLHGIPRTATVRTSQPSVLWRLSGDEFLAAVQSGAASTSLRGVAIIRLARTHPDLAADLPRGEAVAEASEAS
jgi:MFS family permease